MKNLTIDPERLWGDLMETARFGATAAAAASLGVRPSFVDDYR